MSHLVGIDHGFQTYSAALRRFGPALSDLDIGSAWMRAESYRIAGCPTVRVYRREDPSVEDLSLCLRYGDKQFKAVAPHRHLDRVCRDWVKQLTSPPLSGHRFKDLRARAKDILLTWTVLTAFWDVDGTPNDICKALARGIIWLTADGPDADLMRSGRFHGFGYEVVDLPDNSGWEWHQVCLGGDE
jgi:hypothetical protein